jgi:hypothetical protein
MRFARYVFDRTQSTEGLAGLVELAKAERPVINLRSAPDQRVVEGPANRLTGPGLHEGHRRQAASWHTASSADSPQV